MSKEGKTNLKIIFSSLFLLVVMSVMVFGLTTLTILKPTARNFTTSTASNITIIFEINTSNTIYLNISSIRVFFNGTYANGTSQIDRVLCSPNNASGVVALANGSAFSNESARFSCTANATEGFGNEGNWTIWVNATNSTNILASDRAIMNFTVYTIDIATPRLTAGKPFDLNDPRTLNYTSFPVDFQVNVTDPGNALSTVWYIINTLNSAAGSNETNSSANASQFQMSSNATVPQTYAVNITLKFAVSSRSPGPHSVYFCANDSAGNQNCTGAYNYIVKGGNYSDLLTTITGGASTSAPFTANFTYENGTDLELNGTNPNPHFFAPTIYNYTMKMNFTVGVGASGIVPVSVYIVGMAINESLMANMNNQNISTAPPSNLRSQTGGSGFNQSLAWLDIANFLPSFVSYKFGIIKYINYQAFQQIFMCNGSTVDSANCLQLNTCPSTPSITNYTFIGTQTGYNSSNLSLNQTIGACYVTDAGNTSVYTHRFSGGAGSDDTTAATVTLNSPTNGTNSTNVTLPINITINDTGGSGFTNNSGFLNLTVDGILYTYPTNITCLPNTINVTGMTCFLNRSQTLNENSSLQIVVNVDDASANRQNSTFVIKTDRTVPSYITWNATVTYNGSGTDFNFSGNSNATSLGRSFSQSAKQGDRLFILINWSDAISSGGGINQRAATLEVFNTTDSLFHLVANATVTATGSANDSWTNFSWTIPGGHIYTEGVNLTYRINLSDVLGNLNSTSSNSVSNGTGTMNFSFTVNDTQLPNVTARIGTSSLTPVNNSLVNLSGTTIVFNWSVNDPGGMRLINVSFDNNTADSGCGEFVPYGPSVVNNRLNYQIQYPAAGCSGSVKGIESGALTNGTHNITFTAEDSWGNLFRKFVSFNIDNQPPGVRLSRITANNNSENAVNNTNIRFNDTINVTVTDVGNAGLGENATKYATGCNTTNVTFTVDALFAPFNTAGCRGINISTNLTLFYNDSAGNTNNTIIFFRIDDVAPTFVSTSITNGTSGSNFTVSWNVTDAFMNVTDVGFYIDNASGYTDTNVTGNMFTNISNGTGSVSLNLSSLLGKTYLSGRHFIVLTANDSVNNIVNTSPIYFTVDAPLTGIDFVSNLTATFNSSGNVSRIELYALGDDPNVGSNATSLNLTNGTLSTNRNFRIVLVTNTTGLNVSLAQVNGTEVNWAANFTLTTNNTAFINNIGSVFGKNVLHTIYFDNSLDRFISNNDAYYGVITLPLGAGNYSTIYWFEDEESLNSTSLATTVSACSGTFTKTTSTPCYTDNNSFTLVFVPHFSAVAGVNETTGTPPYITMTSPPINAGNITNSSFVVSFATSLDVQTCAYQFNSTTNRSMEISGTTLNKTCTGGLINVTHNTQNASLVLFAADSSGTTQTVVVFNVSDLNVSAFDESSIKNESITNTSVVITWNTTEYTNSTVTVQAVSGNTPSNTTDKQVVQKHSVTVSGLSTGTTYNFTVRFCDFSANCNSSSSQFNFTTSAAAAAAAAAAAGGGGGGGGGAVTPPETNIAASKSQVFATLAAGSTATVNVNKAGITVTQVVAVITKDLTNAEIKVSSLKDKPTTTTAGDKVYQYLDIAPKNIGVSDVSKVTITFTVTRTWLTDNGLDSSDVVLARYVSGSWTELPTTIVSSDGSSVTYSAESPGFSYYAITVKSVAVVLPKPEEKPPVVEEKPPVVEEKKPVEEVVETVKKVAEKAKGLSKTALTWLIILAIVVIGLAAYFIYSRKRG